MARSIPIRERLHALEFARREVMRRGSPDFIRQQELEKRVQRLCIELLRGKRAADLLDGMERKVPSRRRIKSA